MIKFHKKTKKKEKKKSNLPIRINILFLFIFLLFSALILRLGYTQIVKGEEYETQAVNQASNTVTQSVPRGVIYDRNNNIVVGNYPQRTITYTRSDSVSANDMQGVAEKLAELIVMDTSSLKDRDKKDYWITLHPDEAKELVSKEEQASIAAKGEEEEKSDSEISKEIYQEQLDRITKADIESLTEFDLNVLAIYAKMSSGSVNSTMTIKSGNSDDEKEGVTKAEFAKVSEYVEELPGVDAIIDWERMYPYESTLRTVLGKVSSADEGLPSDKLNYYLVRGYSRNDRVGTSYIEEAYEDVLHGTDKVMEVSKDDDGNITDYSVLYEGKSGENLILTMDIELQQELEAIVEEKLWSANSASSTADRAFVVMMDPNTGEVLAMVGKQIVTDEETGKKEMQDYALGTISSAHEAGSSVKGATLLSAWQSGATTPGQIILDERLIVKGQPASIGSYKTMGSINDLTALQKSSNVYMMKSAIAMGGGTYVSGQGLSLKSDLIYDLRYYFNQFGLGVLTGIDLANETEGYIGKPDVSQALNFSIGQYDTYTAMQLAQYVSTIANGGYRMKPQIIKAVTEPGTDGEPDEIVEEVSPVVLNKVEMKDEWIKRIQTGFRMVMQSGGTAYSYFANADYTAAGKTGTAQARANGKDVENSTMIAYAPYENPEVAISVMTPWVKIDSPTSKQIAREALDAYFNLQNGTDDSDDSSDESSAEE